jgi:hypothetical protein
LTTEALSNRLEKIIEPLRQQVEEKISQAERLRQSHSELAPRIEAKCRTLSIEADALLGEGRTAEADATKAEIEQLKADLQDLLNRADAEEQHAWQIAHQQQEMARQVFDETFPELRLSLVEVQRAMCALLDHVWAGLLQYAEKNNLQGDGSFTSRPLVTPMLKSDLTPREHGPERPLFCALLRWFGGRQ